MSRECCIPVVLFTYARPQHLIRTLQSIRANSVGRLLVFSDAARSEEDRGRVAEVRGLVQAIDWCDVRHVKREHNYGLGRNIRAGVSAVLTEYTSCIVWEDDLVAVPGTYDWLCAALSAYASNPLVMSATAWTHPLVTPSDVSDQPYFDARGECLVWGTWTRAWRGMELEDASTKMGLVRARGISVNTCGFDLPIQAAAEHKKNIWAVRWLYHHLQHRGLCVRPPWSMAEHIGFDAAATNAAQAAGWNNPPLRGAAPIPTTWPTPREHPNCRDLWVSAHPSSWRARLRRVISLRSRL